MRDLWTIKGGGGRANTVSMQADQVPPGTRCVIVDAAGKILCRGTAELGTVRIEMSPKAEMPKGEPLTLKALDDGEEYVEP